MPGLILVNLGHTYTASNCTYRQLNDFVMKDMISEADSLVREYCT
jgi:hypothetical protein